MATTKRCCALLLVGFFVVLGACNSSKPATGDASKKITWDEYQKMDAEQKDDPYVRDNLNDEAKKKAADLQRKVRR